MKDQPYQHVIDACNNSIDACNSFITSILKRRDIAQRFENIRQLRDCIDTCMFTLAIVTRQSPYAKKACIICAHICASTAELCSKIDDDYALRCTVTCEEAAQACYYITGTPSTL